MCCRCLADVCSNRICPPLNGLLEQAEGWIVIIHAAIRIYYSQLPFTVDQDVVEFWAAWEGLGCAESSLWHLIHLPAAWIRQGSCRTARTMDVFITLIKTRLPTDLRGRVTLIREPFTVGRMASTALSSSENERSRLRIHYSHHTYPEERGLQTEYRRGRFGLYKTTKSNWGKLIHIVEFIKKERVRGPTIEYWQIVDLEQSSLNMKYGYISGD
jgi:hypothetical protein